jgi:AraC-like DNA-binding protein
MRRPQSLAESIECAGNGDMMSAVASRSSLQPVARWPITSTGIFATNSRRGKTTAAFAESTRPEQASLLPFAVHYADAAIAVGTVRSLGLLNHELRSRWPRHCIVVFPRSASRCRGPFERDYISSPIVASLSNAGEEIDYTPIATDCLGGGWIAFDPDQLRTAASLHIPPRSGTDEGRVFVLPWVATDPQLHLRQRELFESLAAGGSGVEDAALASLRVLHEVLILERAAAARDADSGVRSPRTHEAIAQVQEWTTSRFTERLTVAELSRLSHISPFHLCRLFKAHTGFGIHQYQTELRLRYALDILATSRASISSVALELGFSSHSHFTGAFSRLFGCSPSAYRLGNQAI